MTHCKGGRKEGRKVMQTIDRKLDIALESGGIQPVQFYIQFSKTVVLETSWPYPASPLPGGGFLGLKWDAGGSGAPSTPRFGSPEAPERLAKPKMGHRGCGMQPLCLGGLPAASWEQKWYVGVCEERNKKRKRGEREGREGKVNEICREGGREKGGKGRTTNPGTRQLQRMSSSPTPCSKSIVKVNFSLLTHQLSFLPSPPLPSPPHFPPFLPP
ncbi:Collagen alpha-1(IX) chain, partial [Ophiophagus hannah]